MRFVFRTDGNSTIGLGHITRCLALADKLKRYGDVQFISKPLPIKIPFKVNKLSDKLNESGDLIGTRELLRKLMPDVVIVDHHNIGQEYLNSISAFSGLLVTIDDLNREICSDVVVNVNAFSLGMDYKCEKGLVLLGPKYSLIGETGQQKNIRADANLILISMGGADVLNLTPKAIGTLRKIKGIHATVAIGPAFTNEKEIRDAIAGDNKFSVVRTNELPKLMLKHDIAVCGGGTTLYELASTGTPAIILCQAENQFINARELHKKTLISLGMGDKAGAAKIKRAVEYLLANYKLRKKLSSNGKRLVDGKGLQRVAKTILAELKNRKIELKPAKKEDAIDVWRWRNEKDTRMNSFNTRFIPIKEHISWFGKALKGSKKKILIIYNRGEKIGYVRVDSNGEKEMHIVIGKKYRGLGFGSRAIRMARKLVRERITAKIKPPNTASLKAFERAGFRILKKTSSMVTLVS